MEASSNDRGWLRSAKTTLLQHLRYCELHTTETRSRAENDHVAAGGVHHRLAKDAAGGNQICLSRPIHTQFSRISLTFPTSLLDLRPDTELYCLLMILQDRHLLRLRPQCRHLHLCFLFRSPLQMAHHTVRQFQIVLERQPLAHLCCTQSNFPVRLLSL